MAEIKTAISDPADKTDLERDADSALKLCRAWRDATESALQGLRGIGSRSGMAAVLASLPVAKRAAVQATLTALKAALASVGDTADQTDPPANADPKE